MDDSKIIAGVIAGDSNLFRLIVERYNTRIHALVFGYVHQEQDIEDIKQEIFINAYLSLSSYAGHSTFYTWLYRLALNTIFTQLRMRKKHIPVSSEEEDLKSINEMQSSAQTPIDEYISHQTEQLVLSAIDQLPDNQRTAFVLSRMEDLSQKEIARIMMISEHAVESLLQRAKRKLQVELEEIFEK